MMTSLRLLMTATFGTVLMSTALAQQPFGGEADVNYANQLWQTMRDNDLAGENAIQAVPYEGRDPHGAILMTLEDDFTLEGHTGVALIKRNYRGEDIGVDAVADDPDRYLESITVMYRREAGYDPDNQNWFWAKYLPDGSLDQNAQGTPLAGRVAKGANQGCIACHQAAPGDDYVYTHDRHAPE